MLRPAPAGFGLACLLCASILESATITVTSLDDIVATDGLVTLREAILAANLDVSIDGSTPGNGADAIVFATGAGTITLSGMQLPVIIEELTITGLGASMLTIDAADQSRIFQIGPSVTAAISDLTIDDGRIESADGGGVFNSGALTLTAVTLTGNKTDENGGGIYNGGSLQIHDSTLFQNTALNGGAISNDGTLTIVSSTLSENETGGIAPSAGGGGAIINSGTVSITGSTLEGNFAANGGALLSGTGTMVELTNSTVSSNEAINNAGGIDLNPGGTLTIENSTITGNRAQASFIGSSGGGIKSRGTLTLHHTVVSGNFEGLGTTLVDIAGDVEANSSFNLIGVDTRLSGIVDGVGGNQVGTAGAPVDPLLGPLQNNGGGTQTHALLSGSPALDAGSNAICPSTDQRGEPRPSDGDGDGSAVCDIGAFEVGGLTGTKTVSGDLAENGDLVYTIVIRNQRSFTQGDNPGDELTDTLPGTLTATSVNASSGVALRAGNSVSWNGSLPPGGIVTINIAATVNAGTFGTTISNQGTVNFDSNEDGTNDQMLLTDDPAVGGSADPTTFLVGSGPTDFYTVDPCRVLDTRNADGPLGGPALVAGADRLFVVTGTCGVPTSAKAISVNIAVTQSTGPGNLRLHPGGSPVPTVSSINYVAGQTRSNNAVAFLNATGGLSVFVGQVTGTVHFILDVNGYFE